VKSFVETPIGTVVVTTRPGNRTDEEYAPWETWIAHRLARFAWDGYDSLSSARAAHKVMASDPEWLANEVLEYARSVKSVPA